MHTLLSTQNIDVSERLGLLRDAMSRDTAPARPYVQDETAEFHMKLEVGALATVNFLRLGSRSQGRGGLCRDQTLIRRFDADEYRLAFALDGPTVLAHNDRQIELSPGDLTLMDVSRPYDAWHEVGTVGLLLFSFSRQQMPLPQVYANTLVGAKLSGCSGIGALLWSFATQAARDVDTYDQADAAHLSDVLLDLVGGTLAHELGAVRELPAESQQQVLCRQIREFIRQRLGDVDLTPTVIAEAHHISTRTLHRLFEPSGCTVAEWIRFQRLDRCRHDLSRLTDQPVHTIATRWGFSSHAQFSRAFRAAYDLSPLEYRRQAIAPRHS
ncbi:hypothetical protein GCM10023191_062840 [Actinoallomurus oryzae]|uniref:HTH araC/xylS-type domain-containing protein n=1 Tax=Actinoallomurus oryzae TaxID=502180 RepID=A0ABP8QNY5_9ACTN